MQSSAIEPFVLAPFRGATPSLEVLAARAEFDNGWSRQVSIFRGVAFLERVRTVKDPDIAMGIRRRATDTTQQHMLRHCGKFGVDLKNGEDRLGGLRDAGWNPGEKDHQYHRAENCEDLRFHVKAPKYSPPRRGGVAAPSKECREATEAAQTGWSDRRNVSSASLMRGNLKLDESCISNPKFRISSTRSLLCRHRHTRNLYIDREDSASRGEVKRFPVIAAKGDVRGGGMPMDDTAEFPASRVNDVKTSGAAAVDVALSIDLHTVGHTGLGAGEIHEHAAAVLSSGAVRQYLVGSNMTPPGVCNVENFFVV